MRTLGGLVGISKQTEMLLMCVCALWVNIFDMAIFELSSNLEKVWSLEMDVTRIPQANQHVVRTILSGVVLIRTFTLHMYIAFLIAMFWPASCGSRPTLMLPWLLVSAVKNLGTAFVSFATGIYTCILYGPLRPACFHFIMYHMFEFAPSFYMWIVGLSLYRDLKKPKVVESFTTENNKEELEFNMALRRRKVKSMVDEKFLREEFEARRKYVGTSAVVVEEIFKPSSIPNIHKKISRSLDSMLDAMAAEADMQEIEDFEPLEEGLTLAEKTAKLLGITMSEISRTKQNRQIRTDLPLYPVTAQKKFAPISNTYQSSESPLKLLTETSLYTPSKKPVRPTKSELKSPKDFLNLKTPSDFMHTIPELEVKSSFYLQEHTTSINRTLNSSSATSHNDTEKSKFNNVNCSQQNLMDEEINFVYTSGFANINITEPNQDWKRSTDFEKKAQYLRTCNKTEDIENAKAETIMLKQRLQQESQEILNKHLDEKVLYETDYTKIYSADKITSNDTSNKPLPALLKSSDGKKNANKDNIKTRWKYNVDYSVAKRSEMGCQVSTLSRKFLEKHSKDTTCNFKKLKDELSDINEIKEVKTSETSKKFFDVLKLKHGLLESKERKRDTAEKIAKNKTIALQHRDKVESPLKFSAVSKSSITEPVSPRTAKKSSYLSIHMQKIDAQKPLESQFPMDKFGVITQSPLVEDGYSRMYNQKYKMPDINSQVIERKRSRRKFENAAFRF